MLLLRATIMSNLHLGAKFHFPAVHHETMKLKENTQLTLSFELQKENCAEDDLKNLEIRVTKTDISGSDAANVSGIVLNGFAVSAEYLVDKGRWPDSLRSTRSEPKQNCKTSEAHRGRHKAHLTVQMVSQPVVSSSEAEDDHLVWSCQLMVAVMGIRGLTGTPPDLTLTVQLDILRKEEEGQWRLNLTNDAGTGHVDFSVQVTEMVAGVSVAAFYYFKIRGRPQDRIRSGLYEMIFRRRQNQPASEHIYEEARPVSVLEEEPVPARPTPKPRRKLQDPAVSENRDYLSLVSETADKGEDGERGAAGTSSEPEEP
nr:hypothetical protein BaRGS_008555 [Batillaria attramentaria]